jgi:hypothetical protein
VARPTEREREAVLDTAYESRGTIPYLPPTSSSGDVRVRKPVVTARLGLVLAAEQLTDAGLVEHSR